MRISRRWRKLWSEPGFDPDPKIAEGWRWRAKVGTATVKVEFLCDLDDQPANRAIALPGCKASDGREPQRHWLRQPGLRDRDTDGAASERRVRDREVNFAGLSGYLLAKLVAARERGKEKDYYDLTYVLLNNRAGAQRGR